MFLCENENEMNEKEKELVDKEFISNENTYNMGIGGEGGPQFKDKKHSEETKKAISSRIKELYSNGANNSQYGTCWITDGKENKKVKKGELDFWIKNGYLKGRSMIRDAGGRYRISSSS